MKIEENPAAGTTEGRKATALHPVESKADCRHADLAGTFYPKAAEELKALLDAFFASTVTSVTSPYGVLVPHAGYIYSGRCAACAYAKIPETFSGTFVVIGPSHAGCQTATANLVWETPLGPIPPNDRLVAALAAAGIPNRPDLMRVQENALEVHMPFIRYRFPHAKVVPVLLGDQSLSAVQCTADTLVQAIDAVSDDDIVIIASDDGSHYVPAEIAQRDDLTVLAAAAKLDVQVFYEKLMEIQPSMCGYGCIAVMMLVCKHLGAGTAKLLMYQTSGDATGDMHEVVGYAAMEVV